MLNEANIKDIINWDVETWKEILPFIEKQLTHYDKNTAQCIEIGSREGGISLWMAMKGYSITCSDIHYDLEEAKKLHTRYGVEQKVQYKKVDLLEWNEPETYDVIIIKSVLGALQNETAIEKALANVYRNLKKGGRVLFAENSKSTFAHQQFRKKFTDWGSIWYYFDKDSIQRLFKKFEEVEIQFNGLTAVFGNRVGMAKFFSRLDKYVFNKITPDRMKYMFFGSARK